MFRCLTPLAEREEVIEDLASEYQERVAQSGRFGACFWAWRQTLGSVPALVRRTFWRGMTGFESGANRMRPGGPLVESWIVDLRYALRRLRNRSNYALVAILTIALGAGGTAAASSIALALLLDPLPIADEDQVGILWFELSWTEEEFLGLRPDFPGFQSMAAYRPDGVTLQAPDGSLRRVSGYAVSAELFDVLRAPAMIGRTFHSGEDAPDAGGNAVISYALWRELGADPTTVGKSFSSGGVAHTVVGVMPPGFWFPDPDTRIWTAAAMDPNDRNGVYTLIGRLEDGVSFGALDGSLQALTGRLARNFEYPDPQWDKRRNPSVTPAREVLVGDVRPSLLATLAAMGVILLIGCANVSSLMLAQVRARAPEITLRSALGANRRRLIQQIVIESLLIAALAGVAGAALAAVGFDLLVNSLPLGSLAQTVRLDWTLLWASMLAALVAAVLASIVPGLHLSREGRLRGVIRAPRPGGSPFAGSSTADGDHGGRGYRFEGGIIVAETALAVILVAGAGLLIRSVANLYAIDPGLQADGVAVVDATIVGTASNEGGLQTTQAVLASLTALPGVRSTAAAQILPLRNWGGNRGFRIRGRPPINASSAFRLVTSGYFATMRIPILHGRDFQPADGNGNRVVIINQAFADRFFPGEDPIGLVLEGFGNEGEEIIGVVANALEGGLRDEPVPARYMLFDDAFVPSGMSFVIRTEEPEQAESLLDASRSTVGANGRFVAEDTTTMRRILNRAIGPAGYVVVFVSLLGLLALILGAIGVYGVISHDVMRRTHEYGVRIALGESPSRVLGQVVGRGAKLVVLGSTVGIAAAAGVSRLLTSFLYGITPTDSMSFGAAVFILMLSGVVAAFLPARRTSRIDPAAVLREF